MSLDEHRAAFLEGLLARDSARARMAVEAALDGRVPIPDIYLEGAAVRRPASSQCGEPVPWRHDRSVDRPKYGQDTILSSLQLGVEDSGNYGNCNWGYSCAYTNSISWVSPTQPLPTQVNPRVVFERLFGDGSSAEERRNGRKQNASILDSVTKELAVFKNNLGDGDKARLDTYVDNVRELERRIRIAMDSSLKEPTGDVPFGLPESKHVHFRLMYDLMALAFEGDITRSATFMLGRDLSGTQLPGIRLHRRLARVVASRRQAGERDELLQDQPVSRPEPRLLRATS